MGARKYFCRQCKGSTNHDIIHAVKKSGSSDDDYLQWNETYSIVKCRGCENHSFLEAYEDSQMYNHDNEGNAEYYDITTIYPPYLERGKELDHLHFLPKPIKSIYSETLSAIKANCYILAAGGFRAIIESTCTELKIRKDHLEKRIDLLNEKGHLSKAESQRLHSIRFLGNDALHEIEVPKKEQIFLLLEIVNHLLANLFINDEIIKGKLETMLSTYDDFMILVRNKSRKESVGAQLTLIQLLGNAKRRFAPKEFEEFKQILNVQILEGKVDYLQLVPQQEGVYTIIKEPELAFDW